MGKKRKHAFGVAGECLYERLHVEVLLSLLSLAS